MNRLGPVPPVIPYASQHAGPMRVLSLRLRRGLISMPSASVNIDGAVYPQQWGECAFEIPADRPVSIAVHQNGRSGQAGLATAVLAPDHTPTLDYRGPAHLAMAGELGAPGTVRQRGVLVQSGLCGCLIVLLLLLLGFMVFVFVSLSR
ncbi:hypothetical protein ACIO3S_10415 [Nocardioides sp. NPDC087217]|uniref:hypothetical protein n=1 Tax=Nocardioides sp. NPDC087217 TaxID=3364335 RepID=UPI0038073F05